MIFKLRLVSVLFPSATMEQEPLLQCLNCHSWKSKDQIAPWKRADKHAAKGNQISRCAPCIEKRHQCEHKKWKWIEEGPDLCGGPGEPDFPISLEQLMGQLCEEALTSAISCSTHVSTQELSGEPDDICSIVIGHMWEATGFCFMYVWLVSTWGTMANAPTIQLDAGWNTPRRTELSNKHMNAANQQPTPTIMKSDPKWSLNMTTACGACWKLLKFSCT